MEWGLQFQCAVLLGAEGLPIVFSDEVASPMLFRLAGFFVLDGDNLSLGLEIEIHRPVVDPVGPVAGECCVRMVGFKGELNIPAREMLGKSQTHPEEGEG